MLYFFDPKNLIVLELILIIFSLDFNFKLFLIISKIIYSGEYKFIFIDRLKSDGLTFKISL